MLWRGVMWKSSFDTRQVFCILAVGQNLTFYLCLYSLCLYLLPAVPQLETRLNGGHLLLKDFSHFLSREKSSSLNAVLLVSPSPAERLGAGLCVVLRLEATSVCFCCSLWPSIQTFAFEGHIENRNFSTFYVFVSILWEQFWGELILFCVIWVIVICELCRTLGF